ncbi:hypothetical protein, partial [Cereibacter sphaeroides]|uniref:hypothetical protein n=1 Tax=Cereibacter sphaeroides TaxID=1063 RepID=UPI001F18417B
REGPNATHRTCTTMAEAVEVSPARLQLVDPGVEKRALHGDPAIFAFRRAISSSRSRSFIALSVVGRRDRPFLGRGFAGGHVSFGDGACGGEDVLADASLQAIRQQVRVLSRPFSGQELRDLFRAEHRATGGAFQRTLQYPLRGEVRIDRHGVEDMPPGRVEARVEEFRVEDLIEKDLTGAGDRGGAVTCKPGRKRAGRALDRKRPVEEGGEAGARRVGRNWHDDRDPCVRMAWRVGNREVAGKKSMVWSLNGAGPPRGGFRSSGARKSGSAATASVEG